ncbi:MAG: DUF790 family protein [Chloroflexi bacterium]|nr:DUF790 family protein [Chloroflexota bacterium]
MLTGDLVRPRLRIRGTQVEIEGVDVANTHWRQTAAELIALFESHYGQPRSVWDDALEAYEGDRLDYVVLRGLGKVLCDDAVFAPPDLPVDPTELRQMLFSKGPAFDKPLLFQPVSREERIAAAAAEVGLDPAAVENALFADRPGAYLLVDTGGPWTADGLLARYNLELARGVLYWARQMTVRVFDGYKDFWRYVKLFKLMFWGTPLSDDGYRVELDGPISPFVQSTTRYGRQLAAFLPALLLGSRWQMQAEVKPPGADAWLTYQLNNYDPLPSVFKRSGAFDSKMEANFAAEFREKFGDKRSGWELTREDEVILLGDTVFIPDFAITNRKDGRRALVEILGFWHPDYLRRKLMKVRQANRQNLILLVYERVNLGGEKLKNVPGEVLYFVRKPILKDVMAAVERVAV